MCTFITMTLQEVATSLNASPDTVATFAIQGKLPGARIGKAWVFTVEDVKAFLNAEITRQTNARLQEFDLKNDGRITRKRVKVVC